MSHVRDISSFDWIVILIFIFGLGALSELSFAPTEAQGPGVRWPEAPAIQGKVETELVIDVQEPEVVEEAPVEEEEESWD